MKSSEYSFGICGGRIYVKNKLFVVCAFILCLIIFLIIFAYGNHVTNERLYKDMKLLDDDYIKEWNAEDPRLVQHIRQHYLTPPASRTVPYKLLEPNRKYYSEKTQSSIVEKLLAGQRNGFFVECGAFDGETFSNSLYFEKDLNWTGVLIEPDYASFNTLKEKNRKSWLVNGCLEGGDKPKKMVLYGAEYFGILEEHMTFFRNVVTRIFKPMKRQEVWCFPLLSILLAVNRTKIDFFSLDVENAEMPILDSSPWEKMDVNVFMIEYIYLQGIQNIDKDRSWKRREEIRRFAKERLPQHKEAALLFHDIIFIKNQLGNI